MGVDTEGLQMSDGIVSPEYFIKFMEPGPSTKILKNFNGAQEDVHWQVIDSALGTIKPPLYMLTNHQSPDYIIDLLVHNELPFVSGRLRALIEPFVQDVEFIPVGIETSNVPEIDFAGGGERVEGYFWMNCWKRLDIVDYERSKLGLLGPPLVASKRRLETPCKFGGFAELHLRQPIPADVHAFSIFGMQGSPLFLSETLWTLIRVSGLKVWFEHKPLNRATCRSRDVIWNILNPDGIPFGFHRHGELRVWRPTVPN